MPQKPKLPAPRLNCTRTDFLKARENARKFANSLTGRPDTEPTFTVPTLHVFPTCVRLRENAENVGYIHTKLALDAAAITNGAMDCLTSSQVQWLLFNRHVCDAVLRALATTMLWERKSFLARDNQVDEMIAIELAKIAGCVEQSIGLLRDKGRPGNLVISRRCASRILGDRSEPADIDQWITRLHGI